MIATIIHDFLKILISKKAHINCLMHIFLIKTTLDPPHNHQQLIRLIDTQFACFIFFTCCEVDTHGIHNPSPDLEKRLNTVYLFLDYIFPKFEKHHQIPTSTNI